jgi:hypothetical protein
VRRSPVPQVRGRYAGLGRGAPEIEQKPLLIPYLYIEKY